MSARPEPGATASEKAVAPLPFRRFYPLAVLGAAAGVAVWLPTAAVWIGAAQADAAGWHARAMLFGAVPAALTGFLLTALPRWTGRAIAPRRAASGLLLLWVLAEAVLFVAPDLHPPLAAGYLALLTLVVGRLVVAARDRRNFKTVLLLGLLAVAAVLALAREPGPGYLPFRLAVAAVLGIVMVLGGRVVPAITGAALARLGGAGLPPPHPWIEPAAAAAAAAALAAWVWSPASAAVAVLAPLAAGAQGARLLRWRVWRVAARPSLLALHAGYACIPAGFALAGARAAGIFSADVALHIWCVGAIGLMCMAVMASMIRRHLVGAFRELPSFTVVVGLMGTALMARGLSDVVVRWSAGGLLVAALAWIAAHLLFLAVFARPLLSGAGARR